MQTQNELCDYKSTYKLKMDIAYERSTLVPLALWDTERRLISTLDFSPNAKWLATGNVDGIAKVWDLHRGICISRIERPQGKNSKWREGISQIVFSSDSQYIASSARSTGVVYLWRAETGEQIFIQLLLWFGFFNNLV